MRKGSDFLFEFGSTFCFMLWQAGSSKKDESQSSAHIASRAPKGNEDIKYSLVLIAVVIVDTGGIQSE